MFTPRINPENQLHPCQFDLKNTATQWITTIKFVINQQLTSIDQTQDLNQKDSQK